MPGESSENAALSHTWQTTGNKPSHLVPHYWNISKTTHGENVLVNLRKREGGFWKTQKLTEKIVFAYKAN